MGKNTDNTYAEKTDDFSATAAKTLRVCMLGDALLALFKLAAGMIADSGAMIADGIHSASDVFSAVILYIGVRLAAKESDDEHRYGHERFECVAAIVLAFILCAVGLFIGSSAVEKLTSDSRGAVQMPGALALAAAIVSIVGKEAMFRYTRFYARRVDSGGLMAEAWHHRSDALSSFSALLGVVGTRLGYPQLDAVASLLICLFILKAAYNVFADAVRKMVDRSCDAEVLERIRDCVLTVDGVQGVDSLSARIFGSRLYVDLEVREDGNVTLREAHRVAEQVHDTVEQQFPAVKHIMIHVNPGE